MLGALESQVDGHNYLIDQYNCRPVPPATPIPGTLQEARIIPLEILETLGNPA
jgi:hypothetical protein